MWWCPTRRWKGQQEWKKRSTEFMTRWSELGEIWPQMGWRCSGHAEFRTQCGVEPYSFPQPPGTWFSVDCVVHYPGFPLRPCLGVLGRKPTTSALLGRNAVVHPHPCPPVADLHVGFTVLSSYLHVLFNFIFSMYKKMNDLQAPEVPLFYLNKERGPKVLSFNDSNRIVNIFKTL